MTSMIDLLPHRPPFLWIDSVEQLDPGNLCVTSKTFRAEDPVFQGHFPGEPIVPGVLLIEAAAQTAAVMLASAASEGESWSSGPPRLAAVNWFKFKRTVRPEERVLIEVTKSSGHGALLVVRATLTVEGSRAAEGELTVTAAGR